MRVPLSACGGVALTYRRHDRTTVYHHEMTRMSYICQERAVVHDDVHNSTLLTYITHACHFMVIHRRPVMSPICQCDTTTRTERNPHGSADRHGLRHAQTTEVAESPAAQGGIAIAIFDEVERIT